MISAIVIMLSLITNVTFQEMVTPEFLANEVKTGNFTILNYTGLDTTVTVYPPDGQNGTSAGGSKFVHIPCADNVEHPGYGNSIMIWILNIAVDPTKTIGDSITWDMCVDVLDVLDPGFDPLESDDCLLLFLAKNNITFPKDPIDSTYGNLKYAGRMGNKWGHFKINLKKFVETFANDGLGQMYLVFYSLLGNYGKDGCGHGIAIDNFKIYDDGILILENNFENGVLPGDIQDALTENPSDDQFCVISKYIYKPTALSILTSTWLEIKSYYMNGF